MWLSWLFPDKERRSALEKLHSLDKKISMITLKEENQRFDRERKELHKKLDTASEKKKVIAAIDELNSTVDRYIRVQQDEDYSFIIEHLAKRNICSEDEIIEICDPSDRKIIFNYLMARNKVGFDVILRKLNKKLSSTERILEQVQSCVSDKDDAGELRKYWDYVLQDERDKLNQLRIIISTMSTNEFNKYENDISCLSEKLTNLQKYGRNYLSETALEELTNTIKEYIPREDITYEDIYRGLEDSIVTELKNCTDGADNRGKMIKDSMAKLIYSRLKKDMYVR
jgi:hypothetical protein